MSFAAGRGLAPASERVRLARAASEALRSLPGVIATAGRAGRWLTPDDPPLAGVLTLAAPGGGYEIEVHVIAIWPLGPLEALAERVRRSITAAAKRRGLCDAVRAINVHIDGVQAPGELAVNGEPL